MKYEAKASRPFTATLIDGNLFCPLVKARALIQIDQLLAVGTIRLWRRNDTSHTIQTKDYRSFRIVIKAE